MENNKEMIVVLGNGNSIIYNARVSHAIDIFFQKLKNNIDVLFLTKYYKDSWTLKHFEYVFDIFKDSILNTSISNFYSSHKYTHDTILEAVGTRYVIENTFFNNLHIILTVVTSECHQERTEWIFNEIFKDMKNIKLIFNSSRTTFIEITENRYIVESQILYRQQFNVSKCENMINYINERHSQRKYSNFYFEKNKESYCVKFKDF
jgi:hypothetical protein